MKSEKEFLTSMWSEIDVQELKTKQNLITHELNRQLFFREVFAYVIITALLLVGSLIVFFTKDNPNIIYVIAVFLLSTAFLAEKVFYSKSQEGSC